MTVDSKHDGDDRLLSELLRSLDADAARVDSEFLMRLKDQSTEEFRQAGRESGGGHADATSAKDTVTISSGRDRTMLTLTARLAFSITAVCIGGLAWLTTWFGTTDAVGSVTLDDVLRQALQSETLQLKVVRDGTEADVWVRNSGQQTSDVRWEESPTIYQIASGSRLWEIDEENNTVNSSSRSWLKSDGCSRKVDLLAMLGVEQVAGRFRKVRAVGTVRHADRDCRVFRMTAKQDEVQLLIEAFADAETNELLTIAAWPDGLRNARKTPLAELRLIARNQPVDEAKFVVAKSLSNDGRIGRVLDSQGIVMLRPVMRSRWTPIARQMLVRPGDWLRTDVRGANAATVAMTSKFKVIAGPGSLVEIQSPRQILLHGGEVQITGSDHAEEELTLLALNDQKVVLKAGESGLFRLLPDRTLRKIEKKPIWLAGFEGSSNEESIGSLIANIDGRNVPLTVGYHKVSVEIRDQIARTTIEESFVNRTRSRLEGVFHFPLPQDASISGFGMWIGGELVEADVVEKQRAREIYETILRERRDPGLLEWAGGNIFKARVFPIEGHSEKRIKIVYTQVLPLLANQYRYSYALRSELLQKTPLRELSVSVLINSELPLRSVKSPTHSVRSSFGGPVGGGGGPIRSAHLEFAAQEYSPTRDFEVVCEVESKQSDVVVIPHQRGDDGYFLAQVTLPGADGNWQRELLPDGDPLEVLLVCDTSASMDSDSRKKQSELVASILASLGPKDKFNLAVCDVDCHWLFDDSVEASIDNGKSITNARRWLSDRTSLGWTDLDKAFTSIAERAGSGSHVIYIGDGIVTSGDADSQAFAGRIESLFVPKNGEESKAAGRPPTFHAVSVSSSFESVVLKAIAGVGGGSVRAISGERTPQTVAFELLNEIAQPGLTEVKLEFRGLQVAAVYPEKLPNLAAGTQQIIVGRYLPHGKDQAGEMIITGKRGAEDVRYAARVWLKDAEAGNSFIPRLWARAHMDQLLQQGTSQFIKDEIIGLSEEFHIITPYTSLLVLETDADRERFGVTRRFEMRDGQRFFSEGRDNARYELLQQQMKKAGDWRLGMRRSVLAQLGGLGRSTEEMQQLRQSFQQLPQYGRVSELEQMINISGTASMLPVSGGVGFEQLGNSTYGFYSGSGGGFGGGSFSGGGGGVGPISTRTTVDELSLALAGDVIGLWDQEGDKKDMDRDRELLRSDDNAFADLDDSFDIQLMEQTRNLQPAQLHSPFGFASKREKSSFGEYSGISGPPVRDRRLSKKLQSNLRSAGHQLWAGRANGYDNGAEYVNWVSQLFPSLPVVGPPQKSAVDSTWSEEAIAISNSLLRNDAVAGLKVSLEIRSKAEVFDARWGGRRTSERQTIELVASERWLRTSTSAPEQSIVHWCDGEQRGVLSKAFLLGRVRQSKPEDLKTESHAAAPWSQFSLHEYFADYDARVEKQGDRTVLLLSLDDWPTKQTRVTIDSERHVVLSVDHLNDDVVTSRTVYGPYEEVAGLWWPGLKKTFDGQGRRTAVNRYSVTVLDAATFGKWFADELSARKQTQFITDPLPSVRNAEIAVEDGSAGFEERLVLLLKSSWIQKWDDALTQLDHLEKIAADKQGMRWVHAAVLRAARRNEEVRQQLLARSTELIKGRTDDYFLAKFILDAAARVVAAEEQLTMLESLQPVFVRQPAHALGLRDWQIQRVRILRQLGRNDDFIALQKIVAQTSPWDANAQGQYARDLAATGDFESAYQWLRNELDRDAERHEYEISQLRQVYADLLKQQSRSNELVKFLQEWVDARSRNQQLYDQYFEALGLANRDKEADGIVSKWLEAGRVPGELVGADLARFNASLSYALGQQRNHSMNYILPEWLTPLAETCRFFLRHEHHFVFAQQILDAYDFQQTDEFDQLIVEMSTILKSDADELPIDAVRSMVGWCVGRSKLTTDDWIKIAEKLTTRWSVLERREQRQTLGNSIVQIFRTKSRDDRLLPFMRERIEKASTLKEGNVGATLTVELLNELLTRPWSAGNEVEAFALLDDVSAADSMVVRAAAQVESLHRLVDAMVAARFAASMMKLQDEGHPEELTRTELSAKQIEFQKAARSGMADRLADEAVKRSALDGDTGWASTILRDWLQVERMYFDVLLGRNLPEGATECWKILGDSPPATPTEDELEALDADAVKHLVLNGLLRSRALATLTNLAVRRSAPKGLADRVLKYIDVAIELEQAVASDESDEAFDWKTKKFGLLVALDRPDELEVALRKWIATDGYAAPWQLALGRLLAERARINEAIPLFEAVEKKSPLSPSDYETLANWYLVADRRPDYERARVESFHVMQEHQISNWINQRLYPWQRSNTELPSELDERVLFAFKALFRKSQHPQNYTYQLKSFYQACRDFRLLQVIPDIVVGRTSQQVYLVLKNLQSNLLVELRDEATADEIIGRIKTLQENVESGIDRRALDLLESMVERKSSELLNQPGPHVGAAVAALKRAFDREWADGEQRQMADYLQALGNITQPELADEQMRQLNELHRQATPGTDDRLFIAFSLASGHFNSYGRSDEGLTVMENAIREFDQTHPDGWPLHASVPLSGYVSFLEQVSRFAQAEKLLDGYLKNPLNPQTLNWFLKRQNQVFHAALKGKGRVSLGEGEVLYKALVERSIAHSRDADPNYQYAFLSDLIGVYRTGNNLHLPTVSLDIREFALKQLPPMLGSQTHQYRTLVDQFGQALRDIAGPRYGLEFLMDRVETWPRRMRNSWEDAWSQCGHDMGRWWQAASGKAADLEPRLLKIVLDELRHELTTGQRRSGYFFRNHYSYFWKAKEKDFARVAEEVLNARPHSPRTVTRVSDYLWGGLEHFPRAIEIRLIAHGKGILAETDGFQLVTWLHHQRRWAEAIPILERMVQASPNEMKYRTMLLKSYARSSRPEQRDELLAQIDEHFRGGGRWTEANLAQLASMCVEVSLDVAAVKYYGELIPLAQRSRPNRGIGEGTVSEYYRRLSQSHARLGNTREAVDAASGAIIAWGPRHDRRRSAVNQMKSAINQARMLDVYVEFLDDQLAESGQDSPMIRRMIGEVYASRGQHEAAIAQLKLAAELQPFVRETHAALVKSYDALKNSRAATDQVLTQLDFDRHNLELYNDLAKRMKGDEQQAERAVTTLVEAAPKEAEHHESLAMIRQEQNRWAEAINHWQHVAALRALEPNGLLKLAEAQIHEKRWPAVNSTIGKLKARSWPSRFSNIEGQIQQLEKQIKP
jgi:tetratricopeptide (TPR) repeat protein